MTHQRLVLSLKPGHWAVRSFPWHRWAASSQFTFRKRPWCPWSADQGHTATKRVRERFRDGKRRWSWVWSSEQDMHDQLAECSLFCSLYPVDDTDQACKNLRILFIIHITSSIYFIIQNKNGVKRRLRTTDCRRGIKMQTADLARVVRSLDNAIHGINHYPVDNAVCFVSTYPLDSDLSGHGGWRCPAFEQPGPGLKCRLETRTE